MGYENGKIYVLRSNQTEDIYIGSTTQPLYKRIYQHKIDLKKWKKGTYNYVTSFELMKYDDVYIELLELYPCGSKMELCRREGQLQREMKCINKEIAGRTQKEYRDDNKDKRKEQSKEYREKNKEKLKEYEKEWRETNKDKMKEYYKEYYEANKEKINKQYECECGGKYIQQNKSKHFKSQKHLNYKPLV